jgi:hypothetical protein
MNRRIRFAGLVVGCLGVTAVLPARAGSPPAASGHGPKLDAVTFGILHRVFHEFRDVQRVKLNQDFPLGDTDYSARVVQYLPDFQMDLQNHRFFSLSEQPNNPAFKVVVRKGKAPQDTSWAFLKSPPHFSAKSYFAFHVMKVEFIGRPPLLPDTTSGAPKPAMPPAPGAGPGSAHSDSLRKP